MKLKLLLISIFFIFAQILNAHSVVLNTMDNEDGTMEIFGGFSTGQSAVGAKFVIRSQIHGKILYENRVSKSGTLIVKVPSEPYIIILDSGPGHRLEKIGDIKPKEGFESKGSKPVKVAFLTTFLISLGFITASIIVSRKRFIS